jgi:Endonuclease/Exonuclease/phosphatase family
MHRTKNTRLFRTALAALALSACAPDGPAAPDLALARGDAAANGGATQVAFLSRNLYIGTNLDLVVQALASPGQGDDVPAVLRAVSEIKATDWPSRVVAIADEIERERPQVIGLQEAWDINVNLVPLGLAVTLDLDFLESLQTELASRGLGYTVAASFQGVTAAPLPGISVIDRDVILVDPSRVSVQAGSVVSQAFLANIGNVAPGVSVRRGWVAVSATVDGEAMRIVGTHLESGQSAQLSQLRAFQAGQLVATLAPHPRVIVMGDFNDIPASPMYQQVVNAGFTDAWGAMRPGTVGLTCCHAEVLDNTRAQDAFWMRIDYIFTRGLSHSNGNLLGRITMLGAGPEDRLDGPSWMIWPSDHAGLALHLLLPPAE